MENQRACANGEDLPNGRKRVPTNAYLLASKSYTAYHLCDALIQKLVDDVVACDDHITRSMHVDHVCAMTEALKDINEAIMNLSENATLNGVE